MAENEVLSRNILLFSIIAITIILREAKTDNFCMENSDWKGNSYFEYGSSINLSCPVSAKDMPSRNSNKSLKIPHFTLLHGTNTKVNMIEMSNGSSIGLYVENPPKSKSSFTCTTEDDPNPMCSNTVIVDSRPSRVNDFSCISYNFENLTCTWTPIESFSEINYTLAYSIAIGNRVKQYLNYECNSYGSESGGKMSCTWTVLTYRQFLIGTFYFKLTMKNVFGATTVPRNVSHFSIVLPNPPDNLTVIDKTTESIYLSWRLPAHLNLYLLSLDHKIMHRSEYESNWQVAGYLHTKDKMNQGTMYFNLTNLNAYTTYDIAVSLRSKAADQDETMWSKNSSMTVRTIAKIPATPPLTNIGGFEIGPSWGNNFYVAYIYWKQINSELKNGGNFSYYIETSEKSRIVNSINATNSYAEIIYRNQYDNYTFYIWSKNSVGKSEKKAVMYLPGSTERIDEPKMFTETDYDNGYYELFWQPPKATIKTYTIFWCAYNATEDRPDRCESYLDWKEVPGDQSSYNISVDVLSGKINQFAISANSETSSSGMVWACQIYNEKTTPRPQVEIIPVSSTSVKVTWRYECNDGIASIKRLIVYYCNNSSSACIDSRSLEIDEDRNTTLSAEVHGLKPHNTYRMHITIVNKRDVESVDSHYQYITTAEDAPLPPTHLMAKNVTNSSVLVFWKEPKIANGILRIYKIKYINVLTDSTMEYSSTSLKYNITNLKSNVDYDITVLACTIKCSKPSEVLRVRTLAGYPSKLVQPYLTHSNATDWIVEWKPSEDLNENGTYQLMIETTGKSNLINVTDTKYMIKECGPDGEYSTVNISVRAVNILEEILYGPWSEKLKLTCEESSSLWLWTLTPIVLLLLPILVYKIRQIYYCCREMQKVEVILPPGIQVDDDTEILNQSRRRAQGEKDRRHADGQIYEMVNLIDKRDSKEDLNGCSPESLRTNNNNRKQAKPLSANDLKKKTAKSAEKYSLIMEKDIDSVSVFHSDTASPTTSTAKYCVLGVDAIPIKSINPNYVPADTFQEPQQTEDELPHSNSNYVSVEDFQPKLKEKASDLPSINSDYVSVGMLQHKSTDKEHQTEKSNYVSADLQQTGLENETAIARTNPNYVSADFQQKMEEKESDSPSINSNYVSAGMVQHKSTDKEDNLPGTKSNYVSVDLEKETAIPRTNSHYVSAEDFQQKMKEKESESPSNHSNYVSAGMVQHKSTDKEDNLPGTKSNYVPADLQQIDIEKETAIPRTNPHYVSAEDFQREMEEKESDSPSINSNYVSAGMVQHKSTEKENNLLSTNTNYVFADLQQTDLENETAIPPTNAHYVSAEDFQQKMEEKQSVSPSINSNYVSAGIVQHKSTEKGNNLPATNSNYVSVDFLQQKLSKEKNDPTQNSNPTPCYVQASNLNQIVNSN